MQKNLQTRFSTRQYMLSRDFELYYYNEHYTSKVDTHTHDYYEFYFFMEGDVSIEIEGQRYPLRYGDMVVILRTAGTVPLCTTMRRHTAGSCSGSAGNMPAG